MRHTILYGTDGFSSTCTYIMVTKFEWGWIERITVNAYLVTTRDLKYYLWYLIPLPATMNYIGKETPMLIMQQYKWTELGATQYVTVCFTSSDEHLLA